MNIRSNRPSRCPDTRKLFEMRTQCGNMMGSFEAWLLLRSLRTLHLRVPRQSQTGTAIANWLKFASGGNAHDGIPADLIEVVHHSSLQGPDAQGFTPDKQMEGGYNATFAIIVSQVRAAAIDFDSPAFRTRLIDDQDRVCECIAPYLEILCGM